MSEISMKDRISLLNEATKAYDEGHPIMDDIEWDQLYFELEELEKKTEIIYPNSPTQKISYEVMSELEKVEHSHPMLSLAKTKDWNEFLRYFSDKDVSKSVVGMVKLDGLTCSLEYQKGKLVKAETRGNGIIGENILHNAKVIDSIPQTIPYLKTLILDGEIIITKKDFEPFAAEYANPRNLASGSIRLLDSKECAKRHLTFVVWNVVEGLKGNSLMSKFDVLEQKCGFQVVPWVSSFDWDAKEFLIAQAEEAGYPIDGLVGRFDDIEFGTSLGETGHHTRAAYAFKMYDEEYETELEDIEWSLGRTGQITPVAIFKPVDADGSTISRASLHNLSVMIETLGGFPYRGLKIWVAKQNMIIPQVIRGEYDNSVPVSYHIGVPMQCPVCGSILDMRTENNCEMLYCKNATCPGKLLNYIDHFCGKSGLDIKGISVNTIDKLIDWGWIDSIIDIFKLSDHRNEWINKSGFGMTSVDKILDAINNVSPTLDQFISAIGIPLVGKSTAKDIANYTKSWEEFQKLINDNFDFSELDGIGYEISRAILLFNYDDANYIMENYLSNKMTSNNEEDAAEENKILQGQTIVITGSLQEFKNRAALQAKIESLGGKVTSSISKNTTCLINNDVNSTSSKNLSAKKLNVPIMSERDFIEKYLI